jgi:recombination protein RecA
VLGRVRALRDAVNDASKRQVLSVYDTDEKAPVVPCVSTGIDALNTLISGREDGGFPCGRIVEVRGKEATAKTSIALLTAAQAQKAGKIAALIDLEHSFDPTYAVRLGVKIDELLFCQPDSGEEAFKVIRFLVKSGEAAVVIVDSVAALTSISELDREEDVDNRPGVQAKMMSQGLRKLQSEMPRLGACVIFINQIRVNPMVMYGSKNYSPGGNALAYYASVRLDIARIKTHVRPKGKRRITEGFRIQLKTIKNRLCKPFQELELDVMFDTGIKLVEHKKGKSDVATAEE